MKNAGTLSVAKAIKIERKAQKKSQDDMAKGLGVSRKTYQRFECDEVGMSMDRVIDCLKMLGLKFTITKPGGEPVIVFEV